VRDPASLPALDDAESMERSLSESSGLIAGGDARRAADILEQALQYQPRHQRARNLLGLALFKLGELARSEAIYRTLIEDHPDDPTLRVNLGLVFLKAGAASDAARCFETALDLSPGHDRARNYLGLALVALGQHARARECFLACGNAPMAERMAQALARSPLRDVADGAAERLDTGQPFESALERAPENKAVLGVIRPTTGWVSTTPGATVADTEREIPRVAAPVATAPAAVPAPAAAPAPVLATEETASPLAEYSYRTRLSVPSSQGGFALGSTEIAIHIHGEMLTRLDGLVASWGTVSVKPELKRFRGKATDKPFGEGARRMLRAAGHGRFVISREGRHFTALELGDEPAYFREEILFAFEESLLFENGRVPSRVGADLHLVHLRGHGKLLLCTVGTPRSAEVVKGEPLRVPMDQLVGWHGPGIQPRLVPICDEAPELGVALELAGEGCALLDAPDEPR